MAMAYQEGDLQRPQGVPPRSYSSGYDRGRLASYFELVRHYRKNRKFAARNYEIFCRVSQAFETHGNVTVRSADVLEIGCGQRFPLTLLFHSVGARAVGIDYDFVEPHPTWRSFRALVKRNGLERALKTIVRSGLFDR